MADNGKSNVDVFKVSIESYKSNRQYEKEFFQDDKWYDVVKTEIKNDFVFLYCHRDRFEECILGAIDGLFKKGNNHPQSKQEVKLFFAFSITPVSAYIFLNDEKGESLFCKESIQLTYCFKGVASPPPKA